MSDARRRGASASASVSFHKSYVKLEGWEESGAVAKVCAAISLERVRGMSTRKRDGAVMASSNSDLID